MSGAPSIEEHLGELERAATRGAVADAEIVPAVRRYLAEVRSWLEELHRGGGSGQAVNEANSDSTDRLVRSLFRVAEAEWYAGGGEIAQRVAVIAVGGYARREMSIHSDIDLLFLHGRRVTPYVERVTERLQMWLWDAGLVLGVSTRSIDETLTLAAADATVRTAILDARFLGGDTQLFHEFGEAVLQDLIGDAAAFIDERVEAMEERHRKYGESIYLLQPHVKEGAGGLRDFHTATWATRAAHPTTRGLEDLLHFGLLTEREMEEYRAALDFLWRVRNELHLISRRKNDQMSFELQERVAAAFGYRGATGEAAEAAARPGGLTGDDLPELAVERFMRDYYRHARNVQGYSEIVVEQCRAKVRAAPSREGAQDAGDGFRVAGGQLEIPHLAHLREKPLRLLGVFEISQRLGVPLSRTARRLVRESLDLVDDAFRRHPEAGAAFLRILDAERRVMRTLAAMNEVGLLGRFLPEWEHIVCRWQHVIYHTYTVDVHTLFLVEELRRLWLGKYDEAFPEISGLMQAVSDRPVLYLGALLHDVGKGRGGDHSNKGAELAGPCALRLGLSPERAERVVFIVKQHLLMSHLAQRRDLSDPKLVVEFARTCRDRDNLRNLYLVTFADIRASSTSAWTEWKGQLLRELFERTSEFLETGSDDPQVALEQIEARVEQRQDATRAELRNLGVGELKIDAFFEIMPRRYFISHSPREMARHALLLLSHPEGRLFSTAIRTLHGSVSELILCTKDVHGLYAMVSGVLSAKGINILGAHVYTTRSGLALEVYRVATPPGGPDEQRETWRGVETMLSAVLTGTRQVSEFLRRRRLRAPELPSPRAQSVSITNEESDFYTIVDVAANDRLGLLYDLTSAIAAEGLEIYISKATTVMDQVADTFYVKDEERAKVTDVARLERLRLALERALEGPER
ncbi:MAG TPA: [protein-PII] uridylyltransferase [Myxococcota bacterium]|jgi:[protein-PII] uridylyltransferase|nr:[protein-PII] uridylyltransferase [Myxococcota bacterium]